MVRGDDPRNIEQRVWHNAYKIELSNDMKIFVTFNVGELTPYNVGEDKGNEDLG